MDSDARYGRCSYRTVLCLDLGRSEYATQTKLDGMVVGSPKNPSFVDNRYIYGKGGV